MNDFFAIINYALYFYSPSYASYIFLHFDIIRLNLVKNTIFKKIKSMFFI